MNLTLNDVIGFDALYDSMLKCQRGVQWKGSVAHFILNSVEEITKLSTQLTDGTYVERPQRKFKIYKPKQRDVVAISFRDRVYQRSLNDNVIYPSLSKRLIYDNCSCQKNKGTQFALDRLKVHLHKFYNHYKTNKNCWVLQCDIKGYYPNMKHSIAKAVFKKYIEPKYYAMSEVILNSYEGDIGFNPGSQMIQLAGISVLNGLDHLIKEKLHVKHYVKYMDDFILICSSKQKLLKYKQVIECYLSAMGFELNQKKTKIYQINKGIVFLGFQFKLTATGKVLCFVNPTKVKNDRREIKKLAILVKNNRMTYKQFMQSYQCRRSHYAYGDSTKLLLKMDKFVKEIIKYE